MTEPEYPLLKQIWPELKQHLEDLEKWHKQARILEKGMRDFPFDSPLIKKIND